MHPQAQCELYFKTPYQLLVSVVLSAQATDKVVNRCMLPIYERGFTPETVLRWGYDKLLRHIRQIGLAPTKAKNILALTRLLQDEFAGKIPANRTALESLPGVGRKTASVILGELFEAKTLAVDTHVYRTTARLGLHREKSPTKCEQALLKIIPPRHLPHAHHLFIAHGRYVCQARKPDCSSCLLNNLCPAANPAQTKNNSGLPSPKDSC